jgi:nitrite reductase/ring-hydroxylating ferredoxin subunit
MSTVHKICDIDVIPERGAKGFSIQNDSAVLEFFIVRKDNRFHGYINRCPHTGVNLNWQADQFLNTDGGLIQCSTHGARFRINDGYCVYGPCAGQRLVPIKLTLEHGKIKIVKEF